MSGNVFEIRSGVDSGVTVVCMPSGHPGTGQMTTWLVQIVIQALYLEHNIHSGFAVLTRDMSELHIYDPSEVLIHRQKLPKAVVSLLVEIENFEQAAPMSDFCGLTELTMEVCRLRSSVTEDLYKLMNHTGIQ